MKNPITEQKYDDSNEYVQSLIDSYLSVKREQAVLVADETTILNSLNEAAGMLEETKGRFTVVGTKDQAVIERKENSSYPHDRNEPHPLRKLLSMFPNILGPMIRVEYKESGKKLQDLIDKFDAGSTLNEDETELCELLHSTRKVSPAKPSVTIKSLKTDGRASSSEVDYGSRDSGVEEV